MSQTAPLISVITPAYNARLTIADTIESVIAQTNEQWELLIGDDCSSDETVEFVSEHYTDSRVKLFRNPVNSGPAETRNSLLAKAKGRYIAFLDADDQWLPSKLEKQIALLQASDAMMCCAGYRRQFSNRDIVVQPPQLITYKQMLRCNHIPMLTALVDTQKSGSFRFQSIGHEDYQLWLDLLRGGGTCVAINETLANYNAGDANSVSGNKFKAAKWHWDILGKEPLDPVRRLMYFVFYIAQGLKKNA